MFRPLLVRILAAALGLIALAAPSTARAGTAVRSLLLDVRRHGDLLFAVGERGAILRSNDSGKVWERIQSHSPATLTAISFAPHSQAGWAVGHDATILATRDGGSTWNSCYHGTDASQSFLDVLAIDPNEVIAVGAFGLAVVSRDGGRTWAPLKVETGDLHLNALCRIADGRILVAGEAGFAAVSADSGRTWTPLSSPYDGSFFGAAPLGESGAIVCGLRGHLYAIADLGHPNWVELPTPAGSGLISTVLQLRGGAWLAAGRGRTVLVSRDEGRSFVAWDAGISTDIARLAQAPDGSVIAVGEAGATTLPKP